MKVKNDTYVGKFMGIIFLGQGLSVCLGGLGSQFSSFILVQGTYKMLWIS